MLLQNMTLKKKVDVDKDLHQPLHSAAGSDLVLLWKRALSNMKHRCKSRPSFAPQLPSKQGTEPALVIKSALRKSMSWRSVNPQHVRRLEMASPWEAHGLFHMYFNVFSTVKSQSRFAIRHHHVKNKRALLITYWESKKLRGIIPAEMISFLLGTVRCIGETENRVDEVRL